MPAHTARPTVVTKVKLDTRKTRRNGTLATQKTIRTVEKPNETKFDREALRSFTHDHPVFSGLHKFVDE